MFVKKKFPKRLTFLGSKKVPTRGFRYDKIHGSDSIGYSYLLIISNHHIIHIIWKISLNFQIYVPYDPKISKSIGQKIKFCDFFFLPQIVYCTIYKMCVETVIGPVCLIGS